MSKVFIFLLLFLGLLGLFMEQSAIIDQHGWIIALIDYSLLAFLIIEALIPSFKTPRKRIYLKQNRSTLIFLLIYVALFFVNRFFSNMADVKLFRGYFILIIIRYFLLIFKAYGRVRKLTGYLNSIFSKPAQTVVLSFIIVILSGTLLLMLPFMSISGSITPIDAFFTVTSAVCVTGLIVVDTAEYFTVYGQLLIIILIQAGGLGIMLLSYFMIFSFRRAVSLKDRKVLSFMLNESDINSIMKSVKRIIILTFSIEFGGVLLLFPVFLRSGLSPANALFYSIFHGISAFCNAGFSLFSDSLMNFRGNYLLNFIIAGLIIAGGISFTVLTEIFSSIKGFFRNKKVKLSINTKVVLKVSFILTLVSMLFIYKLEHGNLLYPLKLGEQYLAAFFQAVSLRTAGFNTIPFDSLGTGTLIIMIGFMFIGGASGSTAGGIKVNTLGIVWAYIQSFRRGHSEILLYRHKISKDQILRAFTVIVFSFLTIFFASFFLILTETSKPVQILFESVSAFGTVGLSTGITSTFSITGKLCLIILMFAGRIGPLTLLTASSRGERESSISYPEVSLLIG